jgi:hypothetical protein
MTTNSCVMVPALCTRKVTRPGEATFADGETANWARVTSTLRASGPAAGAAAAAGTAAGWVTFSGARWSLATTAMSDAIAMSRARTAKIEKACCEARMLRPWVRTSCRIPASAASVVSYAAGPGSSSS